MLNAPKQKMEIILNRRSKLALYRRWKVLFKVFIKYIFVEPHLATFNSILLMTKNIHSLYIAGV
jgi:hypothetical protein